jgi:hypothetical protein
VALEARALAGRGEVTAELALARRAVAGGQNQLDELRAAR